jgi:TATA-binding protein-associated factor Taf7
MTPGPPEPLTPEKILGVWRAPTGPTAYLLKRVGDRILGIACDSKCEDGSYSAFIESAVISRNTLLVSIAHVDAAGEPTANLLSLYLAQGRLTGTFIGNTRPDRRSNFVWIRQHDPDAPKDSLWRGVFEGQP